jgi:hypothetical protein
VQLFAAIHLDDITVMLYADVRSGCPQRKRSHRNSLHPHSARNLSVISSLTFSFVFKEICDLRAFGPCRI